MATHGRGAPIGQFEKYYARGRKADAMLVTHRSTHVSTACLALAAAVLVSSGGRAMAVEEPGKVTSQRELRQQRKKAARRQRRIIFNNDGCDLTHFCKEATPDALLDLRTTRLVGTQVDTVFYNTGGSFSLLRHNTKVGQIFACKEEGFAKNKTQDFIDQGTDALQIMVEFCHRNNIECFWSMRMNDIHDSYKAWYAPYIHPQLKRDHPEWLMGSRAKPPKRGRMWSAVDYGRKEIRDLAFKFHEEVCENYDVDGIELDFFRQLTYFRRPAMGQDASQEDRDKMTNLLHRIRTMTERVGLKRGRPILVAVHVPDSAGYCEAIGLDICRWMKEDLIDILVASGDFRLNPWEVTVKLGHRFGVQVYACLSNAGMRDSEARKARTSLACWRGRAMNVCDSGADGVYTFNFFNPKSRLWREVGDPAALATLDKVYCASARGVKQVSRFLADGERFLNRSVVSPDQPRQLDPRKPLSLDIRVGADVCKKGDLVPDVKLRLRFTQLAKAEDVSVKLNGKALANGSKSGVWVECPVSPALVEKGMNRLEVALKTDATTKAILHDVLLWVRYKNSP